MHNLAPIAVPVEPVEDDEGVPGVCRKQVDHTVDLLVGGAGGQLQADGLVPQLVYVGEDAAEGIGCLAVVALLEVAAERAHQICRVALL